MPENKFDQIKLDALIKFIQDESEKLLLPANKKKFSSTSLTRKMRDIRDMKQSCMARLRKKDRLRPDYFPIGSLVEYTAPYGSQKGPVNGVVKMHDGWGVQIQLEGQDYLIKVDPANLILRHIRIRY